MSIVYAIVRRDGERRGLVMVSTSRDVAHDTAEDLRLGLKGQKFDVVPVTLAGMARFMGYRRVFDRTHAELRRVGTID